MFVHGCRLKRPSYAGPLLATGERASAILVDFSTDWKASTMAHNDEQECNGQESKQKSILNIK